jgi:hypothetical protein
VAAKHRSVTFTGYWEALCVYRFVREV